MITSTLARKPSTIATLNLQRAVIYVFLILLLVVTLFPIYILFINATRSTAEINQGVSLFPSIFLQRNLQTLREKTLGTTYFQSFLNSVTISSFTTLLTCYFGAMTAHGLHTFRFRGNKFMLGFILAVMMIPPQLGAVGFIQILNEFKLMGTNIPLIVPAAASPFAVFFFLQYFKSTVPLELVQAARIDGANELSIFHSIVMPLILPGLAVNAIFAFIGSWNNFMMPFIILGGSPRKFTLPMMSVMAKTGYYFNDRGALSLGMAITVIPLIVVYAFLSRFIIAGVALGGVKE